MASAYGIIHNYGEPQSTFDTDLALQALEYKQNKYDANMIKMEQVMTQYGMQINKLVRDEDREYLYGRLNNLVNNIEGLRGADFSSNNVTSGIIGHINQALDPYVIKQIGNSQKISQFQSQVQAIAKDDPEKFSQLNYQDALITSGYQSYMNGESDDLGNLSYTPYIDNQKDITSKIKEIKDVLPNQTVQIRDGQGNIIEKKTDNLTVTEWMQYMPSLISDQNRAQFAVEGRAALNWNNQAAQEFKNSGELKQQATNYQRQRIEQINLDLQANPSTELKNELLIEKQQLNSQIAQIENQVSSLNPDATSIGTYMMMNNMVGRLSSIVGSQPSVDIKKDQAYFDNLKEQKLLNPNVGSGRFKTTARPSEGADSFTTEDFQDIQQQTDREYNNIVNQNYTNLSADSKSLVDKQIDKWTNPDSIDYRPNISEEEARYEAVLKFTDDLEVKNELATIKRKRDNVYKATKQAYDDVNKDLWTGGNLEKMYKAFNEDSNIRVVSNNGMPVNVKNYLNQQGISSTEDMERFLTTEKGKDFKAQVYSQYFRSDLESSGIGNMNEGLFVRRFDKTDLHNIKRLAETLGEGDVPITDIIEIRTPGDLSTERTRFTPTDITNYLQGGIGSTPLTEEEILNNTGDLIENGIIRIKAGTKTAEHLQQVEDGELYTTKLAGFQNWIGQDKSFYNDSAIRDILDYDNYKKEYNDYLNQASINIAGANQIVINTAPSETKKTEIDYELQNIAANPLIGAGFQLKMTGQPVSITTEQVGEKTFFILSQRTQGEYTDRESGERVTVGGQNSSRVSAQRMMELAPNVYNNIRQSHTEGELVFDNNESFEIGNIRYEDSSFRNKQKYTNFIGAEAANLATKEDSKRVLREMFPSLYEGESAGFGGLINNALNKSNRFKLQFNKEGRNSIVTVFANIGTDSKPQYEKFQEVNVSNNSIENVNRILNAAPQIMLTQALMNAAIEIESYNLDGADLDLDSFRILNQLAPQQ